MLLIIVNSRAGQLYGCALGITALIKASGAIYGVAVLGRPLVPFDPQVCK